MNDLQFKKKTQLYYSYLLNYSILFQPIAVYTVEVIRKTDNLIIVQEN